MEAPCDKRGCKDLISRGRDHEMNGREDAEKGRWSST